MRSRHCSDRAGRHGSESSSDVISYLPVTSAGTIGATIGAWFGATDSQLNLVFPNLRDFTRNLGFPA